MEEKNILRLKRNCKMLREIVTDIKDIAADTRSQYDEGLLYGIAESIDYLSGILLDNVG